MKKECLTFSLIYNKDICLIHTFMKKYERLTYMAPKLKEYFE